MPNQFGVPEITVHDLAARQKAGESFTLLDVREQHELAIVNLGDSAEHAALSQLVKVGPSVLPEAIQTDKEADVVVMCHHGGRSAQVAAWLRQQGWQNVINLDGGIHAYALLVDPSLATY